MESRPASRGASAVPSFPGMAPRIFHFLLALLLFLICFVAYWLGMLSNALNIMLLLAVPWMAGSRLMGFFRGTLEYGIVRRPLVREVRPYVLQFFNHGLFWGLVLATSLLAVIPVQLGPGEFRTFVIVMAAATALALAFELIPSRHLFASTNAAFAIGWVFLAVQLVLFFGEPSRADSVVLDAPFRGEWYVIHGGRSALFNHHYSHTQQRHALDIDKPLDGRDVQGDPDKLESYAAYGQQLYAPAAGKVVAAVNDRPDMAIGDTDDEQIIGNHVIIEMGPERYVLMAHLMKGSVTVAEGDMVRAGQPIARCGNSGNTSAPHLHLQVQNRADFWASDLETFPIFFRNVDRIRFGRRTHEAEGYFRRNDWIAEREN